MMFPEIIKLCDDNLGLANCKSRNDFIEEAIKFYVSYLQNQNNNTYLTESVETAIRSSIQQTEDRLSKLLFKLSVELSMLMHIVAAGNEVDESTLRKLRGKCIQDVKASIGSVNFESILNYQQSQESEED